MLDSFNENVKLPVEAYLPDKVCPPHLSPFVDDKEEGYVPKQREVLDKLTQTTNTGAAENNPSEGGGAAEDDEDAVEARFLQGVAAEASGVWASEFGEVGGSDEEGGSDEDSEEEAAGKKSAASRKSSAGASAASTASGGEEVADSSDEEEGVEAALPKKTKAELAASEELERRKALMPKKHKRLFQRIEKGEKQKEERARNLAKKRVKAEKKAGTKKVAKK